VNIYEQSTRDKIEELKLSMDRISRLIQIEKADKKLFPINSKKEIVEFHNSTNKSKIGLIEENKSESIAQKINLNPGVSMYLRGVKKLKKKAQKLNDLRKLEEEKKVRDCTFKPNIKPKINRISQSSNLHKLPIEDRLIIFEEDKQNKVERMRQIVDELAYLECTFKPRINQ
jgi:hypothetical protein